MKVQRLGKPTGRCLFKLIVRMLVASTTLFLGVMLFLTLACASGGAGEAEGHRNWANFGWRAFNFALLAGFFYWLFANKVRDFFSGRRQEIKTALAEAMAAKEEAEKKFSDYDAKLDKATEEINALAELIRTQGLAEKERIIAAARGTSQKMKDDAITRMEQEIDKVRIELRAEAVRLSVQMAENILKQHITQEDHNIMVGDYIEKVVTKN